MKNKDFKNNEENHYNGMSDFYDDAMLAGYYDYMSIAQSLANEIENNSKILEVGVGTGLFMEKLYKIKPNCIYYGIDHTQSMITQAEKKLNPTIKLLQEDITLMKLDEKFDVIFSHGGVWVFLEKVFLSHIFDDKKNIQGLKNIKNHLNKNGKVFINIQPNHSNSKIKIKDNIIFEQIVDEKDDFCYKDYHFKKDGKLISSQRCTYRLRKNQEINELFTECGLIDLGITSDGKFRVLGTNEK
ncbi:MAG: class I SAM-dependent methyltransferase [Sulfurovum sp.]